MAFQISQQTATTHMSGAPTLPGIVTDQPEIFESIPEPYEETLTQEASDLVEGIQSVDEAFECSEVPIKDAFSFFAEREQVIAQFFVQRYGEYKIKNEKIEDETDVERYYRLVSEITELLDKFKSRRSANLDDLDPSKTSGLSSTRIVENLEHLSSQLKLLEIAAHDGSLNENQFRLDQLKSRLDDLPTSLNSNKQASQDTVNVGTRDDLSYSIKLQSLERQVCMIENLLGRNEENQQLLYDRTKCETLYEAADRLSAWVQHFLPGNMEKVDRELDYLGKKLETLKERQDENTNMSQIDEKFSDSLNKLCLMVNNTDKHRALVPTLINRLNMMEELQRKASQVVNTVTSLEQVQSKIEDGLKDNELEVSSLKTMFAKNIELMKEFSNDIDKRISSLKEKKSDA